MLGACVYCMCTAIGINLLSHSFKPIRLNYYCPHLVTAETNQKQKNKDIVRVRHIYGGDAMKHELISCA